jgi:type I restriction enzyme S subunit
MVERSAFLKDLLLVTKDGEWGKGEPEDGLVEMLAIRGTDFSRVRYCQIDGVPTRFIPSAISERKKLQPRDILIETAGGTRDQPTGRTVILKPHLFVTNPIPITCASFSRFMRINTQLVNPEFVFWYLQFLYATGQMEEHQVQHTGVSRFQFTRFSETVRIPLPPRDEQQTIARTLGALDNKIQLNQQMNKTLEAIAKSIFKHWFIDFEFPNEEGKPYKSSGGEIVYNEELRKDVPKGWKVGRIGDMALHVKDQTAPYENPEKMYRLFSIEAFDSGMKPLFARGSTILSHKFVVRSKTVLVSKLNPRIQRVWPVVDTGENSVCSTEFLSFKPKDNAFSYFYNLILTRGVEKALTQMARGTSSSHQRISADDIRNIPIPMPGQATLELFERIIVPTVTRRERNTTNELTIAQMRDLLLRRLMSGKLRMAKEAR